MFIFSYLLAFLFTISIIILIHELGHYTAARFFNIPVKEFSFGFGKLLWQSNNININKCQVQIRVLLIGGFVNLDLSKNYPIWQRLIVVIAGPLFSLLSGCFIFWLALLIGMKTLKPEVAEIVNASPAAQVTMKPGEIITSINSHSVSHWGEIYLWLLKDLSSQGEIQLQTIDKQNITHSYTIPYVLAQLPRRDNPIERFGIIQLKPKSISDLNSKNIPYFYFKLSPYEALIYMLKFTALLLSLTFIIFYKLALGIIPLSMLTGPLGIAIISKQAWLAGISYYLYMIGTLSIQFAAINLLPIPGLDGAEPVYQVLEKTRGKAVSPAMQELLRNLSIALLIILTGIILSYDIERFFS